MISLKSLCSHEATLDECVQVITSVLRSAGFPMHVGGNGLRYCTAGAILMCWMGPLPGTDGEDWHREHTHFDLVGEYKLPYGASITVSMSAFKGDSHAYPVPFGARVQGQGINFGIPSTRLALPDVAVHWHDIIIFAKAMLTML